jgi:hypothetical protein
MHMYVSSLELERCPDRKNVRPRMLLSFSGKLITPNHLFSKTIYTGIPIQFSIWSPVVRITNMHFSHFFLVRHDD